jgi:urease accessory protein
MNVLEGHMDLVAGVSPDGRTVLASQSFQAPFHLSKPYWDADAGVLHVQVVNPTAGVLAGDALRSSVEVRAGAAVLVTTPSATRIFRMEDGRSASSRQEWRVEAGGWLEVSPEPLVPHRGSRFTQETTVDVASGGACLLIDQLMPGRLAYGEAWQWDRLTLGLTVRIGGRLVLRERFDQTGEALRELSEFHGTGPQACFANLLLVLPTAETSPDWVATVRALHGPGLWVGVTSLAGPAWSLRLVADGPLRMRDALTRIRSELRKAYPRLGCPLRRP